MISTRNGSTKSLDVAEAPVRAVRVVFRLNPAMRARLSCPVLWAISAQYSAEECVGPS